MGSTLRSLLSHGYQHLGISLKLLTLFYIYIHTRRDVCNLLSRIYHFTFGYR